ITSLGYGEASTVFTSFPAPFAGQNVDNTSVLVKYVYSGDADLNGTVDTIDFNLLAANFSQSGKVWTDGDFDYSGTVDTIDFNLLASNFSLALAGPGAGVGTLVPEPTAIGITLIAGSGLLRRRKKS